MRNFFIVFIIIALVILVLHYLGTRVSAQLIEARNSGLKRATSPQATPTSQVTTPPTRDQIEIYLDDLEPMPKVRNVKSMDKSNQIEMLMKLTGVNDYYTRSYRVLQITSDSFRKLPPAHQSVEAEKSYISYFSDPKHSLAEYVRALMKEFSVEELDQLIALDQDPLVQRYHNLPEMDDEEYREYGKFTKSYDSTKNPKRDSQIEKICSSFEYANHSVVMTRNMMKIQSKLMNQPELASPEILETLGINTNSAGKLGLIFQLRSFSDEEISHLADKLTQNISVKEQKLKQRLLEKSLSDYYIFRFMT